MASPGDQIRPSNIEQPRTTPQATFVAEQHVPTGEGVKTAVEPALTIAQRTVDQSFGGMTIGDRLESAPAKPVEKGPAVYDKAAEGLISPAKAGPEEQPHGNDRSVAGPKATTEKPPTDQQLQTAFGPYASDGETFPATSGSRPPNWFVPSALDRQELAPISQGTFTPSDPAAAQLEAQLKNDPSKHVLLPEGKVSGSVYIDQGSFGVAPPGVPMHTADLGPCAGLVVVDGATGQQYLAHVDASIRPDQIRDSLKGFDLNNPKTKIYMLPGGEQPSTVPQSILGAFAGTAAAARIKMVDWNGGAGRRGISIYKGQIMQGSNWMEQQFE